MRIGNRPKEGEIPVEGKMYWWFHAGKNINPSRYLDWGWRQIEFCLVRYRKPENEGDAVRYRIRLGFSYWLPFERL